MDVIVTTQRHPRPGETVPGTSLATAAGGKGLNQAVAAVRAGAGTEFLGTVGSDDFGHELRTTLLRCGVGTAGLRQEPGSSGVAVITVDDAGENTIVVVPGANSLTTLTDSARMRIGAAQILVCQLEIPVQVVAAAARSAREQGTLVLLNPSPVQPLPPELLQYTDIVVANEREARQLATTLSPVPHVVVTRGAAGAAYSGPDGSITDCPAFAVNPVDTTGAGDAFTGALAAHWQRGPTAAIRYGCAAGALATTVRGASAAMPVLEDIEALLRA